MQVEWGRYTGATPSRELSVPVIAFGERVPLGLGVPVPVVDTPPCGRLAVTFGTVTFGTLSFEPLAVGTVTFWTATFGTLTLGAWTVGTVTFGTATFGTLTLGAWTVGTVTFGTATFGTLTLGAWTVGTVTLGTVTLGAWTVGTVTFGTATLGTVTLGTVTLGTVTLGTLTVGTVILGTVTLGTLTLGTGTERVIAFVRSALANAAHRAMNATTHAVHQGDRNLTLLAINLLELPIDCFSEATVLSVGTRKLAHKKGRQAMRYLTPTKILSVS